MMLTEIYFDRIFSGTLVLDEEYQGEDIKTIQIRAAATYLCYSLYLINKAHGKNWSIEHFEGVAEDIVWNVLDIKKRPYKFKATEKKEKYPLSIEDVLLREACRIWKLGYKFLNIVRGEEIGGEMKWLNYWDDQIRVHQSEND